MRTCERCSIAWSSDTGSARHYLKRIETVTTDTERLTCASDNRERSTGDGNLGHIGQRRTPLIHVNSQRQQTCSRRPKQRRPNDASGRIHILQA